MCTQGRSEGGGGLEGGLTPPPPYSVDKNRMRKFKNTVKCREKMAIKCEENSKKMPTKYQVAQDC
jgi:hypothetical protein